MFDKRLTALCPESKKYIAGNIVLQWIELCMNAVMIGLIAVSAERLYRGELTPRSAAPAIIVIAITIVIRFFVARYAVRMSYLASRTVKRKLRDLIYKKLLRLGMSYREKATTAEIVQESVEGVDQLESYFGQYVPQFFYAFIAPVTLFVLFTAAGSLQTGLILLLCVPLIPGTIMMVQKIAKKILAKYWDQYTKLGSTFLENLQGMTTLKPRCYYESPDDAAQFHYYHGSSSLRRRGFRYCARDPFLCGGDTRTGTLSVYDPSVSGFLPAHEKARKLLPRGDERNGGQRQDLQVSGTRRAGS